MPGVRARGRARSVAQFRALATGPTDDLSAPLYPLYAAGRGRQGECAADPIGLGALTAAQATVPGLAAGHPAAVVPGDAVALGRCPGGVAVRSRPAGRPDRAEACFFTHRP